MPNVSPGVYTKIIDLSTYVAAVPSTIAFVAGLAEKGRDNELVSIGSRADLISEFGEPNISKYGKNYGQGLYCAYNYLGESGALFFLRPMSDNASFANVRIDAVATDTTSDIQVTYIEGINTEAELQTNLVTTTPPRYPICFLYPIGRGEYYNKIGVRITQASNPLADGLYILDIYEKQSDGQDTIIESFEISFDPEALDTAGDSVFITYVLERYSAVLRAQLMVSEEVWSDGFNLVCKVYDKNIGAVTVDTTVGAAAITDNKQDFSSWEEQAGQGEYIVIATDDKGKKIWGWLGAAVGPDYNEIPVYTDKNLTTQSWNILSGTGFGTAGSNTDIQYVVKQSYGNIADPFSAAEPIPLKKGTEGDLIQSNGNLDTAEATQLLVSAYNGTIDDDVLDTENVYFSMVFDCGYPNDVKTSIVGLVNVRRDCVAILDNGDNSSAEDAITARESTHPYNTYFAALYEPFNKVYDSFTGQDVWFSPMYHMSYILPKNDVVGELWFAPAGYNRAAIDNIKELRFNPKLNQRDEMYLNQLNPIVKFNPGYVVWGQLTTQAKASALQDLNIVRLVLYCKRALEEYCRYFIFEQNDALTWSRVQGDITIFLDAIQKKRGLDNYTVEVGANDYEKKTKTFHVNVTLQPTRVVEKIELNFYII